MQPVGVSKQLICGLPIRPLCLQLAEVPLAGVHFSSQQAVHRNSRVLPREEGSCCAGALAGSEAEQAPEGGRALRGQPVRVGGLWVDHQAPGAAAGSADCALQPEAGRGVLCMLAHYSLMGTSTYRSLFGGCLQQLPTCPLSLQAAYSRQQDVIVDSQFSLMSICSITWCGMASP